MRLSGGNLQNPEPPYGNRVPNSAVTPADNSVTGAILQIFGCAFTLLCAVALLLSLTSHLVFPYNHSPAVLGCLAVVCCLGWDLAVHRKQEGCGFRAALLLVLLCVLLMMGALFYNLDNSGRKLEYTSPQGTATVMVEYDMVSRPSLYHKHNWLLKSEIPLGTRPGFMETDSYEVNWLSETEIQMGNTYGESYVVNLVNNKVEFVL